MKFNANGRRIHDVYDTVDELRAAVRKRDEMIEELKNHIDFLERKLTEVSLALWDGLD